MPFGCQETEVNSGWLWHSLTPVPCYCVSVILKQVTRWCVALGRNLKLQVLTVPLSSGPGPNPGPDQAVLALIMEKIECLEARGRIRNLKRKIEVFEQVKGKGVHQLEYRLFCPLLCNS